MSGTTTAPALPYEKVKDMSIVIPIQECAAAVFSALIADCIAAARNPEKAQKALRDLDYGNALDRWYALNELAQMGVTLPIGKS